MGRDLKNVLKENSLSVTESRLNILELFYKNKGALAHADIESLTNSEFDRVTIYRTLQSFLEKGILHSIPSTNNTVKYALCKEECSEGHHHDNHVHFICDNCNRTICVEEVEVPDIKLPKGFNAKNYQMVVTGICRDCK